MTNCLILYARKVGEVGMSWSIPSKEEAEEYTRSYLAAQEAYYEEHMDDCCETCDFYECGKCYLDIGELVEKDYSCKFYRRQ